MQSATLCECFSPFRSPYFAVFFFSEWKVTQNRKKRPRWSKKWATHLARGVYL